MNTTIDQLETAVSEFGGLSKEVMQRQVMLTEQQKWLEIHPAIFGTVMKDSGDLRRLRQRARMKLATVIDQLGELRQNPTLSKDECAHIADLCRQSLAMCLMSGLEGEVVIEIESEFRQRCQE